VILPDGDGPGKRHAAAVAAALASTARSVIVLELPHLHGPNDVSDWLARGNTVQKLLELTARARFTGAGLHRPPRGPQKLDLIFDAAIDSSSKLAMLALLHCSSHDGGRKVDLVKVSAATLGQMTGLHRVTAQKLVARLREYGILRRDPHGIGHVIAWDILAIGPAVGAASA